MRRTSTLLLLTLAIALLVLIAPTPVSGAGFSIFEQGTKAMGMAGAFTAQADDPSALFHNAGGLAFFEEREFAVGITLIALGDSEFTGGLPFPGPTVTGAQEDQIVTPPHLYYVQPLGGNWTFGLGVNSPFGLVTEWENPDQWAGRFLSNRAELVTIDVNPTLGWRATENFGIGFGITGRFATVELDRRASQINPFTFAPVEVAQVALESDMDSGFGWNVGILHKVNNSFSWGLSYRSTIEIDFGGDSRLTQVSSGVPALDAAVAAALPFGVDLPIEASLEFPDVASLGFLFALSRNVRLETDFNWTGWSTFDELVINFTTAPALTQTLRQDWEDVYNYRIGLLWNRNSTTQWRFGYVFDETPQPDETVSPLLPGADRNGYTIGYGHTGGKRSWDIAFMYLPFDDRTTTVQENNFNGTYETNAMLLGLTVGF